MRRYEFEDVVKVIDAMRDEIKLGHTPDAYDMTKWLDDLAMQIIEGDDHVGELLEDAEDQARDAMNYQETYLDMLHHAERHIEWLENEFEEQIVPVDRYERDC